ncbi:suppressor APC domain-containing protein 1-like [Salvelinus fontinalis]|uniref:suppressor APC domain-containing protein 1-like n=1 Tax=Salvelinus fontinalis TaxID=8038 RepID=UPI002485F90F|nr:suppressor APC domain-containing protein 1-like [Salvelinus fontinalis]
MAYPQCPAPGSYTMVIIPLRSSLYSLDALRFYLWIKRLKNLEREQDYLWAGLQVLEQARLWYRHRLEDNRSRQANVGTGAGARAEVWGGEGVSSCRLRSQIQRVNGSLGSLMIEPNVTGCPSSPKRVEVSDNELRWQNTVLVQEVSEKNFQISLLELERDRLLQELSVHLGAEV